MTKTIKQTPFEIAIQQVANGELKAPSVSYGSKSINYFGYQLAVHKFELSLSASGMIPRRGWKLKPLKEYYGFKGKSAKECKAEIIALMEKYGV
jgi:hypothetical protein